MRTVTIYENHSLYRDNFKVQGYVFGTGKKAACIIGNMRENEYQQLYCCSCLVKRLKQLESEDKLIPGYEILVIPSANPYSMNIEKRFCPLTIQTLTGCFPDM